MKPTTKDSILSLFDFTNHQRQAATDDRTAISVTAGAGSGKTRTLVGRYLHLLEKGYPLRSLVAITFTDKAAREMRTRIRSDIEKWLASEALEESSSQRELWEITFTELDAARIGTIHSLCAEILRAHPAEAGVDPKFTVLEEGLAAAFRAQSVDTALAWAATSTEAVQLFGFFKEYELRRLLSTLLDRRLDVGPVLHFPEPIKGWAAALSSWLDRQLRVSTWSDSLEALASHLARQPDDKLELARREVLAKWEEVRQARAYQDWDGTFIALAQLRRAISTGGRKANWASTDQTAVRAAMGYLREHYDTELSPLVGKASTTRWELDEQVAGILPALRLLVGETFQEYQRLKDEQQTLDFDDLEGGAAQLLNERFEVRQRWQREISAVLVDEFQDTNDRQRQIVYALTGFAESTPSDQSADLFVVGDAKQSIYKFRGADVTVFRQVQSDIAASGGLSIDLDITFRTHKPLLSVANTLLASILGETEDPTRPYQVPFAPLHAYRQLPASTAIRAPYVEFHLGLGENAKTGRAAAAVALAERLHELHQAEEFDWGQMALLFRASTAFSVYEDALEWADIPFVTVAGRGFYDRPEIRDLLNALTAIADPTDDLALTGLLRSPAFGLPDADLYHLRFPGGGDKPRPLWETLNAHPSASLGSRPEPVEGTGSLIGNTAQTRARDIITELHTLSGRAPAAEVLKRFLDLTGYRTILGTVPEGGRLQRNVDKLLSDAHRSRLVGLGEFLAYVQTLRDVGLREGEAPVEAGGAVQLMTVHKAKGLEFPLVVIADAAYDHPGGAVMALLDADLGLLLGLRAPDGARPVAWRLAGLAETARDDAEVNRLLYVAATRAQEKLLVSGHVKRLKSGRLSLRGWLARLGQVIGLNEITLEGEVTTPRTLAVRASSDNGPVACTLYPQRSLSTPPVTPPSPSVQPTKSAESLAIPDLVANLQPAEPGNADYKTRRREADPPQRVWRVVPRAKHPTGPAWVVGKLVHEALRRWRFPDADDTTLPFDAFIRPYALEAGLTDPAEIRATIRETTRLLERFHAHPLCAEIRDAESYHEVPYTLPNDRGIIDVLYRSSEGWTIVDFKTDELRSEAEIRDTIRREGYDKQVQSYADAVARQLGQRPRTLLVFLRVGREVRVHESGNTDPTT